MPLDTLRVAKQMEAAGMPRSQSEALAAVLNEEFVGQVVTNSDLGVAVDRLETKIEGAEQRLEAKIDHVDANQSARSDGIEQRLQMLQWMLGLVIALCLGILWKLLR